MSCPGEKPGSQRLCYLVFSMYLVSLIIADEILSVLICVQRVGTRYMSFGIAEALV